MAYQNVPYVKRNSLAKELAILLYLVTRYDHLKFQEQSSVLRFSEDMKDWDGTGLSWDGTGMEKEGVL